MAKKKDRQVSIRVTDHDYEAAEAKARARGSTISKVLRAFLFLWIHDETPPGYPPDVPQVNDRAKEAKPRRPRGKQKPPAE